MDLVQGHLNHPPYLHHKFTFQPPNIRILLSIATFFEKFCTKILANTTTDGKIFGGVFLDISRHPESKSAIRMAKF
jgi:hypothetical protein